MIFAPVQTSFNENKFTHESINKKENREKIKHFMKELNKVSNYSYLITRPKRPKNRHRKKTTIQVYTGEISVKINNKIYGSVFVGICRNQLDLYIFGMDYIKRFRVKDIESFELISLTQD